MGVSNQDDVSSPCVQRQLVEGQTVEIADPKVSVNDAEVSFTSYKDGQVNAVSVSEYSEQDPFGISEWVEFFAVFYNKEQVATDLVDQSEELWTCHERLVSGLTTTDGQITLDASVTPGRKPKVLWAQKYPEAWGGAYAGASCPNYYCDMIESAGAVGVFGIVTFPFASTLDSFSYTPIPLSRHSCYDS